MATARKQLKKKHPGEKADKNVYDFGEDEKKELSASEEDVRGGKNSELYLRVLALAVAIARANCINFVIFLFP